MKVRTEIVCNTCGDAVRDRKMVVVRPYVAYEFDGAGLPFSFRVAGPESTERHVCGECLAAFAGLHEHAKAVGLEGV